MTNEGGHGGGDRRMLEDIFALKAQKSDPLDRAANHHSGAWSILTGIAGKRPLAENRIVSIS